jgi:ATP-dependent Clp protease adaptor protein ClpS
MAGTCATLLKLGRASVSPSGECRTRHLCDRRSNPINEPKAKEGPAEVAKDKEQDIGQGGLGLVVEEAQPKLRKPPLYQVVLLNDDYTPMEFVVDVLERIFALDRTRATRVMLEVHTRGKGVCGVYTFEIAETKVAQVMTYARQHQHPLLCTMEET